VRSVFRQKKQALRCTTLICESFCVFLLSSGYVGKSVIIKEYSLILTDGIIYTSVEALDSCQGALAAG